MKVVLNLTIKRKWFDMIASGEKREEYRDQHNVQVKNAFERIADVTLVLRNGYRMNSPALAVNMRCMYLRNFKDSIHPEWGEPTDKTHFVIELGDILSRGTYAEIKKYLKKGERDEQREEND